MSEPIEVEAPDGTVIEFPAGTSTDTIKKVMARNYPRPKPKAEQPSFWERAKQGLAEGAGDIVQAAGDTIGIVTNPVGQLLYNVTGHGNKRYDTGEILRDAVGLPQSAPGIGRTVRQAAAGGMLMGGAARGAASLASPGVAKEVFSIIGKTPIRDAVAGAGAGVGATVGGDIGENVGGQPGRMVGQTAGMLAGGVAGYGVGNRVNAMLNSGPRVPTAQAQAAARQQVDMLPADAGGMAAKGVTSAARASPISAGPIVKQSKNIQGQMQSAVGRIARSQGDDLTTDVAGQSIREAAKRFTKETSARASRLYDKASQLAGDTKITPTKTIAAIDAELAKLSQNPDPAVKAAIKELTTLRENIAGGVSVQGLRDARSSLSQGVYNGQLRSGADQARYKAILGNIADDISDGLGAAGKKDAANMFKRADAFWKGRVEHIDEVLQPIVGKEGQKGGEQIVTSLESMARGNSGGGTRLSRLLANMTKEEAGQVRATLVDRLGKATPGAQDASGQAFSASTFLTNWNKMTPQAKASLFSDPALRGNLDDIALLAEKQKAAFSLSNTSNTAIGVTGNVGAQVALTAHNPVVMLLNFGSQALTGKLMASPAFARLLAKTAKMPPEAAGRAFKQQLGVLAAREPSLSGQIERLMVAMNDNVGAPAAADDGEQDPVRIQLGDQSFTDSQLNFIN